MVAASSSTWTSSRGFGFGPNVDHPISPMQGRGRRANDIEPQEVLSKVRVIDADGTTDEFPLSEAVREHLALFDDMLHLIETNSFLPVREDGDTVQILNLNTVATIEVPTAAYYGRSDAPNVADGAAAPTTY